MESGSGSEAAGQRPPVRTRGADACSSGVTVDAVHADAPLCDDLEAVCPRNHCSRIRVVPANDAIEALDVTQQPGFAELLIDLRRFVLDTELGETRTAAQNGLGVALLYQGEPMAARAAYGKAIDADPGNEKARANLAALRCRYGDQDGAKKELAGVKNGALAGADVDPEWRSCR